VTVTAGPDQVPPALSAAGARGARRLVHARGRAQAGCFLAEGPQAVREALGCQDNVVRLIVAADALRHEAVAPLVEAARRDGVPVGIADAVRMADLTDTVHAQGVVAVCRQRCVDLEDVGPIRLAVVAAQVRDPGNLGTIIRAADAFGADAVVLTPGCVEPWNPKAVRASVGSVFHVPLVVGVPLDEAAGRLRGRGVRVLAAEARGERLDEWARAGRLAAPAAWVVGNEAWGLPEAERALCDAALSVPMWGRAESLNVAAALAVCLYATALAQHEAPGQDPGCRAGVP